jgi:hypothetical protein
MSSYQPPDVHRALNEPERAAPPTGLEPLADDARVRKHRPEVPPARAHLLERQALARMPDAGPRPNAPPEETGTMKQLEHLWIDVGGEG